MGAGLCKMPAGGSMNPMIIVQHRWRAQKLERSHGSMTNHVNQSDSLEVEPNLHEDHSYLRQRRVREQGFCIGLPVRTRLPATL